MIQYCTKINGMGNLDVKKINIIFITITTILLNVVDSYLHRMIFKINNIT